MKKTILMMLGALSLASSSLLIQEPTLRALAEGEEESPSGESSSSSLSNINYYLCLSNQNYRQKNANRFNYEESDSLYHLEEVTLSNTIDFYVGGDDGTKWLDTDGTNYRVDEANLLSYDFLFSPTKIFSSEENGYTKTNTHFTYKIHTKDNVKILVNEVEKELTYNAYQNVYEAYYLSSIELHANDVVKKEEETHTIENDGYYRIVYTPGKTIDGNEYLFDENGNYGSGDDYIYHLYIEDAPLYYLAFEEQLRSKEEGVGVRDYLAYPLTRDESKVTTPTYRSPSFFVDEENKKLHYMLYRKEKDHYKRVDEDDEWSKTIMITDRGWNQFLITDNASSFSLTSEEETADFKGFYLAGDMNDYLYDEEGRIDLSDDYKFVKIGEDGDYYNKDYDQYLLTLLVDENGASFYISNGKDKYRDGKDLITINDAGRYDILFSEEHVYGRGRHYRYSLLDETKDIEEVEIASTAAWNEFASHCNSDASYSENKVVYLTKDIDFVGISFTPIQNWSGAFYGSFHILKNITLSSNYAQSSVFELVSQKGSIERLLVENFTANLGGTDNVGLVGKNYGNIDKITLSSGELVGKRNVGLVAINGRAKYEKGDAPNSNETYQFGTISNCVNRASIRGGSNVGGIAGLNLGIVKGATNEGSVSGYNSSSNATVLNIGGIAGYGVGKIYDSLNKGKILSQNTSLYVGGIAGLDNGECYFVKNEGSVQGDKYIGGIVGYYGSVSKNENDLTKYFEGTPYEEFVKDYFATGEEEDEQYDGVKNAFAYAMNFASVRAKGYVGGIIGSVSSSSLIIKNSMSHADILASSGNDAGGIVGDLGSASVRSSFSTGKIKAKKYVGGIAGNGGTILDSFSSATLEGDDYVGGLAGYASAISSSISNTLLLAEESNAHVGEIAGGSSAYIEATSSFSDSFAYNYYVGNKGGVNGVEYASNDAAKHLLPSILASKGTLSSALSLHFDHDYWVGGNDEKTYPVLKNFLEVEKNDDFGDENEFAALFAKNASLLSATAEHDSRITYLVSFMEWREEGGDLYNEASELQYQNYENTANVRLYDGDILSAPEFVYAIKKNDQDVYEGKEGTYLVSYSLPSSISSNTVIYASYQKATTALKSEDQNLIVVGLFSEEAKASLVFEGNSYRVKVTMGEQEIPLENVVIKVKKSLFPEQDLYFLTQGGWQKIDCQDDGEYFRFVYSSSQAFTGIQKEQKQFPLWATVTLSLLGGIALTSGVSLLMGHRKKKKAKAIK